MSRAALLSGIYDLVVYLFIRYALHQSPAEILLRLTGPLTDALLAYLFLVLLVIPGVLGLLLKAMLHAHSTRALVLRVMGWETISRDMPPELIPTSWDYFFSRGRCAWVIATFEDGSQITGFYGPDSFATSYPDPPQLYLEKTYRRTPEGLVENQGLSCILCFDKLRALEILSLEEERHAAEKER
jgi:hypothetical protein